MPKMGKLDRIRLTISKERNTSLIYNHKVVFEIQNTTTGKVHKFHSNYHTLQSAVDHAASYLTSVNLGHCVGFNPNKPEA